MKEKRRDNKGRILHTGESQRTDGKYLYKYVDAFGNTKYVYAWRLTPTDPVSYTHLDVYKRQAYGLSLFQSSWKNHSGAWECHTSTWPLILIADSGFLSLSLILQIFGGIFY